MREGFCVQFSSSGSESARILRTGFSLMGDFGGRKNRGERQGFHRSGAKVIFVNIYILVFVSVECHAIVGNTQEYSQFTPK